MKDNQLNTFMYAPKDDELLRKNGVNSTMRKN